MFHQKVMSTLFWNNIYIPLFYLCDKVLTELQTLDYKYSRRFPTVLCKVVVCYFFDKTSLYDRNSIVSLFPYVKNKLCIFL